MRSGENQKVSTTSHITCPSLRQSIYITNCYISYLYHNIYMFIYSINLICVICSNLSIGIPISHLMLWLQGAYWTGAIHLLQEAWRKGPGCSECGAVPALDRASSQGPQDASGLVMVKPFFDPRRPMGLRWSWILVSRSAGQPFVQALAQCAGTECCY